MSRAVTRWQKREGHAGFLQALEEAQQGAEMVSAQEEFEASEEPPQHERPARKAPALDRFWVAFAQEEDAWRWYAADAGLSAEEIEVSWAWFARHAWAPPPVLEETGQPLPDAMPDSVRRVLTREHRFILLADDPLVDCLRDELHLPIPDDQQALAEDWQFWDDVGQALTDPPDVNARRAMDRLATLVRLKPEHVRRLAQNATMAATKRRLVQEAVLLSLGVAKQRIRIGRRRVKADAGHPITLEAIFGRDGLEEVLTLEREGNPAPIAEVRADLERSLGGPFRPAQLADRAVYRNWLTKEIRRQVDTLLGEDLDVAEPGRCGGSRRKVISYDETEPLPDVPAGRLSAATRGVTKRELRGVGERDDRESASFRPTARRTQYIQHVEKKRRMEDGLAHRIDWTRLLDRIWDEREAPVLRTYIECVRQELLLFQDDEAASRRLGWSVEKVYDVKRRLKRYLSLIKAEQRWKSLHPNTL